jgi:hypothetical protein
MRSGRITPMKWAAKSKVKSSLRANQGGVWSFAHFRLFNTAYMGNLRICKPDTAADKSAPLKALPIHDTNQEHTTSGQQTTDGERRESSMATFWSATTATNLLSSMLQHDETSSLVYGSPTLSSLTRTILQQRIRRQRVLLEHAMRRRTQQRRSLLESSPMDLPISDPNDDYSARRTFADAFGTQTGDFQYDEASDASSNNDGDDQAAMDVYARITPRDVSGNNEDEDVELTSIYTQTPAHMDNTASSQVISHSSPDLSSNVTINQPLLNRPLTTENMFSNARSTSVGMSTEAATGPVIYVDAPLIPDRTASSGVQTATAFPRPGRFRMESNEELNGRVISRNAYREALSTTTHPSMLSTEELAEEIQRLCGLLHAADDPDTIDILRDRVRILEQIYNGRMLLRHLGRSGIVPGAMDDSPPRRIDSSTQATPTTPRRPIRWSEWQARRIDQHRDAMR